MSARMDCTDPKNGEKFFFRYITEFSSTNAYSQQFNFTDNCFANQMKPVLSAMKYIGVLPVAIPKSGKLETVKVCLIPNFAAKGDNSTF